MRMVQSHKVFDVLSFKSRYYIVPDLYMKYRLSDSVYI